MPSPTLPPPPGNLASSIKGVWWLLSREDYTKNGERRIDPTLGADPIAILTYAGDYFAAQFMKRDRKDNLENSVSYVGQNNTVAVGGYDAYFGTYKVDEQTGIVEHILLGSLTPGNVGMKTFRDLRATNDELTIQLETTTLQGEPITRTLVWKRIN
jgi:hypothetical protein